MLTVPVGRSRTNYTEECQHLEIYKVIRIVITNFRDLLQLIKVDIAILKLRIKIFPSKESHL